ncbi:hypothetical protein SCOR_17600 [Sulfidibacter corallicola]|uniref:Uncharacterized protein n=1 Tax=Sulfidibacter corallicola TaxID=2818388 RepID=A0A8A4TW56_SULCO|nr:ABC transporter permease [Sulfidibacter corallicola]QTD53730.1 hypothetical protein J3U87_14855 [Sulfidibacter corallicola]
MNAVRTWWSRLDDLINPVVVKEVRQAVRGRFVSVTLNCFLLALLATSSALLPEYANPANIYHRGYELMQILVGILLFTTLIFVPIASGVRLALERSGDNIDLLYISAISPRSIVLGKMLASSLVTALFFFAAAPFITMTYFLRGTDFVAIMVSLFVAYLAVLGTIQLAICLACFKTPTAMKVILAAGFLVLALFIFGGTMDLLSDINRRGLGGLVFRGGLWERILVLLSIGVIGGLGLFFVSVALIKPDSANKGRQPRAFFFVAWTLVCLTMVVFDASTDVLEVGAVFGLTAGIVGMLVAVSERDDPGLRVRREIPVAGWRRAIAFAFFSGSASGMVWSVLMMMAAIGFSSGFVRSGIWNSMEEIMVGVSLYTVFYGLAAHLLHRHWLKRFFGRGWTWLASLVLLGLGMFVPWALGALLFPQKWSDGDLSPYFFLWNPFTLSSHSHRPLSLAMASIFVVILVVLRHRWFFTCWSKFKAEVPSEPPPRRGTEIRGVA